MLVCSSPMTVRIGSSALSFCELWVGQFILTFAMCKNIGKLIHCRGIDACVFGS